MGFNRTLFASSTICLASILLAASPVVAQSGEESGEASSDETPGGSETPDQKTDQKEEGDSDGTEETVVQGPDGFEYAVGDGKLEVRKEGESASTFRVPCSEQAAADASTLYVSCGDDRVLTLTLDDPADPDPTGIKRLGKDVAKLYAVKNKVWVEFADGVAGPIKKHVGSDEESTAADSKEKSQREAPGSTQASASEKSEDDESDEASDGATGERDEEGDKSDQEGEDADSDDESGDGDDEDEKAKPIGRVIRVEPGFVVVDAGGQAGLEQGDFLKFYAVRQEKLAGDTASTYEEQIGAGKTVAVGKSRARVELKMNDRVPEGSMARRAENVDMDPGTSVERVGGIFVAEGAARPFLPIDSFGVGALLDAKLSYYFENNIAVEWSLSPFGFTITESDNDVISFASNVIGSYDTRFVQVGLGLGVARLQGFDVFTTLSAVQKIRLGTRDGGHFTGTTNFVLSQDGWRFGGIRMKVLAPFWSILPKTWSMVRFQSGVPGQTFIEAGLRIMTSGNGTEGSTFVTPLLGYGFIRSVRPDRNLNQFEGETVSYGGPLVGIEVEKRF